MPIYEYTCPSCGRTFEKRVSFNESDERQECPHCGGRHARRQMSLIARTAAGSSSSGGYRPAASSCGPVG